MKSPRNATIGMILAMGCLGAAVAACSANGAANSQTPPAPNVVAVATTVPEPATETSASQPTESTEQTPTARATLAHNPDVKRTSSARTDTQEFAAYKKEGDSLFDTLMDPFVKEAQRRRAELAKTDPEFGKRIDKELNAGRVNFLLFGYGESHEPPNTERALIGSHTIISYDFRYDRADIVSLTHDIRGPEIERELTKRSQKSTAVRIDQAYNVGGFKLMRRVLEDATGLSVDFQVTFKDSVMQHLIDDVFNGVVVDVPTAFDVQPFYLDGIKYPKGSFPQGSQRLNGRQVVQFIKTVPISAAAYDKSLEHNARKHLIFNALLQSINQNYQDRDFWLKGSAFVTKELVTGGITYDFDPIALMINNIGSTVPKIKALTSKNGTGGIRTPQIKKSIYVVDPAHGDGGVQWVNANAAVNPITKKDIESGVYSSLDMEVPIDSNPYGDPVTEYWQSVRALVKQTFMSAAP